MPPTSSLPPFMVTLVTLHGSVGDVGDLLWLVCFVGDLHLLAWLESTDVCRIELQSLTDRKGILLMVHFLEFLLFVKFI
nr:hypothetical protein [Tanacetum cinerariifolium]